ncbi:phage tail protein [Streptomyces vinaceus]|uniref:phage tail protein n=1 Tax=Streptomyces vinaceus TaxID=1960 RepID=UPI00381B6762
MNTPYPIGRYLPAVYQEDGFAQRFTGGLDDVLAPAIAVLDSLDAYVDAALTPEDFLPWLASWVGLVLDENLPADRQRELVAAAAALYARRGTRGGLLEQLNLTIGPGAEVIDSGQVITSDTAGRNRTSLVAPQEFFVRLPAGAEHRRATVEALVAAFKPAHVLHTVEATGP